MSSSRPTWRQLSLLSLVFFLLLFVLGFLSLFHKAVDMSAGDLDNLQTNSRNPYRVKHTQLFVGEAAGEHFPGRVQCKGGIHAAASSLSNGEGTYGACSLSHAEKVSFVTFFVPCEEPPDGNEEGAKAAAVVFRNVTITKADRPYAILSVLSESVQKSNPNSSLTILTSEKGQIQTAKLPFEVHVARIDWNFTRSDLMLLRLESYAYFIEELLEAKLQETIYTHSFEHVVFMDADIIVVDNLRCLFETYRDFDIALTFRNNRDQPINSGVIIVRGEKESLSRARAFLLDVVEVYRERFATASRMLGDQLALSVLVQKHSKEISSRFKKPSVFQTQIAQLQVLFLPSLLYNWTPSEGAGQFHGMPINVKVLHFKGSRKRLMLEAWALFMQTSGSLLDMECLILRSGRAKYDF